MKLSRMRKVARRSASGSYEMFSGSYCSNFGGSSSLPSAASSMLVLGSYGDSEEVAVAGGMKPEQKIIPREQRM